MSTANDVPGTFLPQLRFKQRMPDIGGRAHIFVQFLRPAPIPFSLGLSSYHHVLEYTLLVVSAFLGSLYHLYLLFEPSRLRRLDGYTLEKFTRSGSKVCMSPSHMLHLRWLLKAQSTNCFPTTSTLTTSRTRFGSSRPSPTKDDFGLERPTMACWLGHSGFYPVFMEKLGME